MMYFCVYTSEVTDPAGDTEALLSAVRKVSRERNPARDITGILLFDKGRFLQVLEGEQDAIEMLMSEIERDPRHHNIKYLFREPIKRRSFSQWNMETLDLSAEDGMTEDILFKIRDAYSKNFSASAGAFVKIARQLLDDPRFRKLIER